MQALPLAQLGATPWPASPLWFLGLALIVPGLVWLALAWRRALLECPNRVRRAGTREMRRLSKRLQRSTAAPTPVHLQSWLVASARMWDVKTSAPCAGEVSEAAQRLSRDEHLTTQCLEIWRTTEHCLYSTDAPAGREWVQRTAQVVAIAPMPKRERLFPNRVSHWLPTLAVLLVVTGVVAPSMSHADVPWSAPPAEPAVPDEPLSAEAAQAAQTALDAHWNDWAAHHNLAAYETQQGNLNVAIAHALAAFVQHPANATTRATLLAALGETEIVDANLRRLLLGSWYERAPTLLSPSAWQRIALFASLLLASALIAALIMLYRPVGQARKYVIWTSRAGLATGAVLLITSISCWNAYGSLNQPDAAVLLQSANVTPVPTDLVSTEETSPLSAGAIVRTHRTFLRWLQVTGTPEVSGWVRGNVVMPLYEAR